MKLVQINSCCGCYSTGRIMSDISDTFARKKENDCVCLFGRNGKENEKNLKFNGKADIYSHVLRSRITDKSGFYSSGATKKMIRFIKEYSPDIVHLHNIHGYYLNIKLLFEFLKEYNRPVVWTLHDCWAFTGHCAHFDYVNCEKWKSGCYDCPQKCKYPGSYFKDNSKNNYQMKKELFTSLNDVIIVTPSQWLAELAADSFLGKYPIEVINNGIDTKVFKPTKSKIKEKYSLKNKKIVLGVASTWGKRKGLDDFAELSKLLSDEYKIVLVGLTKKQIKNLPDNILGITCTENAAELAAWYTAADVFVNPTYEDNFPTVNLEAQSCGTFVVTYNSGGSAETIAEHCGQIVEKGDINALAENIIKGNKIENVKEDLFDKNECFENYISLYNKILG